MKAVAKTMVLVLLLGVMGAAGLVAVSASEDIPPAGYADEAGEFAADEEMVNYSAAAARAASGRLTVADATSVYVGNLENAPALMADALTQSLAANEADEDEDEYPDEDGEYEEPMAINDQPDTGRASVAVPAAVALLACALVPVVRTRK